MHIVYIHTDPLPSPMAGSVFALSTAVGCALAGHRVTLMMPGAGRPVDDALDYYGVTPPAGLEILLPSTQRVGLGPASFTWTGRYYRAVAKAIEKLNAPDVIVVRTLKLAAFLSARSLPAPLMYEMHDWYADVARKWEGAAWMITPKKMAHERRLESVEHETIPRLAGVIALKESTAALMRETYPGTVVAAIPTGLNPPDVLPAVSSEPVVVYAGQLHRHKGLDTLLDALKRAVDLRAVIVGGGDPLADLRANVERRGLADRVELTGHVPAARVGSQLARGRVGVLPLLDCFFNRTLTSPLKIMEYYAAGLPVVTADAPVTREIVDHESTGLLTPFADPDALAAALRRLCFDDDLHARCRARIAERLPEFSWENRGRRIAEFAASVRTRR